MDQLYAFDMVSHFNYVLLDTTNWPIKISPSFHTVYFISSIRVLCEKRLYQFRNYSTCAKTWLTSCTSRYMRMVAQLILLSYCLNSYICWTVLVAILLTLIFLWIQISALPIKTNWFKRERGKKNHDHTWVDKCSFFSFTMFRIKGCANDTGLVLQEVHLEWRQNVTTGTQQLHKLYQEGLVGFVS